MDLIEMTRELGKAMQKGERYLNFAKVQAAADQDKELQDMIGKFNLYKMDMQQEVQKSDRDQEKIKKLDSNIKEVYSAIMQNENMTLFNAAKKEVDDMISFMQQIIVYSANGEDPDTIEPQDSNCSGSCASCAGCS